MLVDPYSAKKNCIARMQRPVMYCLLRFDCEEQHLSSGLHGYEEEVACIILFYFLLVRLAVSNMAGKYRWSNDVI
jgi:hypothetical protein